VTATITQHLNSLSQHRLTILKESITEAGLMHSNGNSPKKYFRGLANDSSGKLKKIYVALSKYSHEELNLMFNTFVK